MGVFEGVLPSFFYSFSKINIRDFFYIHIIWYICSIKNILNMTKVIHVHLIVGLDGVKRKDWYFGSISAVFEVFTPQQIGFTKNYLLHAGLSGGGTVVSKRAIIQQNRLITCKRKGGNTE